MKKAIEIVNHKIEELQSHFAAWDRMWKQEAVAGNQDRAISYLETRAEVKSKIDMLIIIREEMLK